MSCETGDDDFGGHGFNYACIYTRGMKTFVRYFLGWCRWNVLSSGKYGVYVDVENKEGDL